MIKYDEAEFIKQVDIAYRLLWDMYAPTGGCPWDSEQEQKLLNMLNAIDKELGR